MNSSADRPSASARTLGNVDGSSRLVRTALLRRRHDIAPDAFREHWRNVHARLVARLPGLRGYHQNLVVDRAQRAIDFARGPVSIDGISQLWFDDEASAERADRSEVMAAIAADETRFIDDLHLISTMQRIVVDPVGGAGLLKRMSTIRRRDDVDPQTFQREWFEMHAMLVKRLPQVKGYAQNLIVDRRHGRHTPIDRDRLPIDGIVELWFDDAESLESAFRGPAGLTLMSHAREFLSEISTFLVDTREIV